MFKRIKYRFIIAIVLAVVSGLMSYNYLKGLDKKVTIVVAAEEIQPFTKITSDMLKEVSVHSDLKSGLMKDTYTDKYEVVGAVTRKIITKGYPMQKNSSALLYEEEKAVALNEFGNVEQGYFIPYDKRVISIETDSAGALSQMLKAGDFIDMIFTSMDDSTGGVYSNMLFQHMQIFKIGKVSQTELKSSKQTIYLLATPDECVEIALAKRNGLIDLVLNPLEGETDDIFPVHIEEFIAERPMTKRERLDDMKLYILEEELSQSIRDQMIMSIEREVSKESIMEYIDASQLEQDKKAALLNLLKE